MPQEEKHGTDCTPEAGCSSDGYKPVLPSVLGEVVSKSIDKLPESAITAAVSIFSLGLVGAILEYLWLSAFYPDKVTAFIGGLTALVPLVTLIYQAKAKRGKPDA